MPKLEKIVLEDKKIVQRRTMEDLTRNNLILGENSIKAKDSLAGIDHQDQDSKK